MTSIDLPTVISIDEKARKPLPAVWRKNFAVAGKKYPSESLNALLTYMTTQEAAEMSLPPHQQLPGNNAPSESIPSGSIPPSQAPTQASLCPPTVPTRPTRVPNIKPNDICPLPNHQNHTWYFCRFNKHGKNGDNTLRPSDASATAATPDTTTSSVTSSSPAPNASGDIHFIDLDPTSGFEYLFADDD